MKAAMLHWLLAQAEAAPEEPSALMQVAPILLMFAVVYFVMLRPMSKQNKEHQTLLAALKKDDEIVTQSGMWGRIAAISDKVVTLEIANNVKVKVLRSSIAGRWNPDADKSTPVAAVEKEAKA